MKIANILKNFLQHIKFYKNTIKARKKENLYSSISRIGYWTIPMAVDFYYQSMLVGVRLYSVSSHIYPLKDEDTSTQIPTPRQITTEKQKLYKGMPPGQCIDKPFHSHWVLMGFILNEFSCTGTWQRNTSVVQKPASMKIHGWGSANMTEADQSWQLPRWQWLAYYSKH